MKPSKAKRLITVCANTQPKPQPFMLWGDPGIGKSQTVAQLAAAYADKIAKAEWHGGLIDIRLSLMDSVDMRGIPVVKDGSTVWMTPDMFPRKGKGFIFLDELPQALPIVQSAASSLILDRRIGNYTLPPGWAIGAAGNLDTNRAATNRMPSHIANRFTHINFEFDIEDWLEWAFDNRVNPMICAFGGFKPDGIHKFDPKQKVNPTPRTWEFLSNMLNTGDADDCLLDLANGTIGEGMAGEFVGFVRVFREMPDYETVCKKPEATKIPKDVAARYAVATMLAGRTQQADMKNVMKYVNRMDKEFQILTCNDMTKRNPRLSETSAYITWAAENKDLLLNATVR